MIAGPPSYLMYDGDCPVCARFVLWSRLRAIRPDIVLINARNAPDLVAQLRSTGVNPNDTMVLQLGSLQLVGADAFAMLAKLSAPNARITAALIRAVAGIRPAYPLLVLARKLLLRLLGISAL